MPTLQQWGVSSRVIDPYKAPEQGVLCLVGRVYGHEAIPDGVSITSTGIVGRHDDKVCTKSGSEYTLGDVDPEYEALYPNARERLFSTLPEIA